MSTFISKSITDLGTTLIADILVSESEFLPTKIVIGSGYMPTGKTARTMTGVVEKVIELDINKKKKLPTGCELLIGGSFSSASIAKDFYYREIGIYAKAVHDDGTSGTEVLYCYGNSGDMAELIRAHPTEDATEISVNNIIYIGNDTKVNLEIKSGVVADAQDLADLALVVEGKVDKVEGKGLSSNDYTNADKDKLATLKPGGIIVQATAPPGDNTMLWVDTSAGGIAKYWNGTAWIAGKAVWG